MHLTKATFFLSTVALSSALKGTTLNNIGIVGSHQAHNIHARQETQCEEIQPPFVNGCERSCGDGYEACGSFPKCYNPGMGEKCCDDKTRCPAGMACSPSGCVPEDGPTGGGGGGGSSAPTGMPTPTLSDDRPDMPTPTTGGGDEDENDNDNDNDNSDGPLFTPPSLSVSIDLPMPTDAGNRLDGTAGLAMGGGLAVAAMLL